MLRRVSIGSQNFEKIRINNIFYVDKTFFIKEWWEAADDVTLITRPRRFGKTLNMSMLEQFFSIDYAGRNELFEGLSVWEDEKYRKLQGTYPVIALSFADMKEASVQDARKMICYNIECLYNRYHLLLEGDLLNEKEKKFFRNVSADMENYVAAVSLRTLSDYLYRYYGKKVIVLLDEYDTPMQETYINGYWEELVEFTRSLFHTSFKMNPYLERAIMTGITRVSKESVFSDLNNLEVITTTSDKYQSAFGFTEAEVFAALEEFGMTDRKEEVKTWYDGFVFGEVSEIYNPWSVINYLDKKRVSPYWVNTSSNRLIGKLLREGKPDVKQELEELLCGRSLIAELDEQIVYDQLDQDEQAIWSLLLASGYLKASHCEIIADEYGGWKQVYTLELTNFEVKVMFRNMIRGWLAGLLRNIMIL